MRKILIVAVGVVCALAPATPGHAAPSHNQAVGAGTLGQFGNPSVQVNANQTNAGLKGGFTITYPDGTLATGTLACLTVDGSTAYVTGVITGADGPRHEANGWSPGGFLVIGLLDRGEPGTAGPDQLNFSPGFATDPGCGPNDSAAPDFPIVAGNYRVSAGS